MFTRDMRIAYTLADAPSSPQAGRGHAQSNGTAPPKRWRELSAQKLKQLEERIERVKTMQALLKRMKNCRCNALDECGKKLLTDRILTETWLCEGG